LINLNPLQIEISKTPPICLLAFPFGQSYLKMFNPTTLSLRRLHIFSNHNQKVDFGFPHKLYNLQLFAYNLKSLSFCAQPPIYRRPMADLIERISITNALPRVKVDAGSEARRITLVSRVPDPGRPGSNKRIHLILTKSPRDNVCSLKTDFVSHNAQYKNMEFDILYNHLTYSAGTIADCGIVGGSVVELVPREAVQHAVKIEGFQFAYWAMLRVMIGASLFQG
jgi:hypothetical protein